MNIKPCAPQCPACPVAPSFTPDSPWLAPLAGYSDLPFRLLCRELGAAVCETEMISAKGLLYGNSGTTDLLASVPQDQPLIVQLFGADSQSMGEALLLLRQSGYQWFDCNMGCPVRKVMRQGAGAALMDNFPLAVEIARSMLTAAAADKERVPAKVGFKLRLPSGGIGQLVEFGKRLADAGAAWLTVHPRTAAQGYGGNANWEAIAALKTAVDIPVIASGDLLSSKAAVMCLQKTGADCIMYARGALHNPFIFAQHLAAVTGGPVTELTPNGLKNVILRHMRLTYAYGNLRNAFKKMRSIIPRYAKNFPGVGQFRQRVCVCEDWRQLESCVNEFLAQQSV